MPDETTTGIPPAGTSPHPSPDEGRPPEVGNPATTAVQPPAAEPAQPAGTGEGGTGEGEEEARRAAAALRDVAATGTAIHPGERDSALDLGDAPGTAGAGAGG